MTCDGARDNEPRWWADRDARERRSDGGSETDRSVVLFRSSREVPHDEAPAADEFAVPKDLRLDADSSRARATRPTRCCGPYVVTRAALRARPPSRR